MAAKRQETHLPLTTVVTITITIIIKIAII